MRAAHALAWLGLAWAMAPVESNALPAGHASALSPDRMHVVREARRDRGTILELVDLASGKAKPLVRLPGANRWPVWSPDGLFVAFCAVFQGRVFVTVTDMTGHSWMVQEIHGGLTDIRWSPDAAWLVYSAETAPGNRDLYLSTAGGTDHRQLTNTPFASEDEPRWSSSPNRIEYRYRERGKAVWMTAWLAPDELPANPP
jgi:Tol biopolymer transport system component